MNVAIPILLNVANIAANIAAKAISLFVNLPENINGTVIVLGGVTVANNVVTKGGIGGSSGMKKGIDYSLSLSYLSSFLATGQI